MKEEYSKIGIVAGPCSAENRGQMLETAKGLKNIGVETMRAGLWKPRSRFGTFEGVGEHGLAWLNEIQQELGLKVMTEVALPSHVEAVIKAGIDMVWIGARTSVNPFMMRELAEVLKGCDIPVWIKNPVCPDVELWIGAVGTSSTCGLEGHPYYSPRFLYSRSSSLSQRSSLGVGRGFPYSFSRYAFLLRSESYSRKT